MATEQVTQLAARPSASPRLTRRDQVAIRNGFFTTLITLVAQFLLGMGVNLYVTIPANHPGSNPPDLVQSVIWAIVHGPLVLVMHVVLGLLMVLSGFYLLVRVVRARAPRELTGAAVVGSVSLLFAAGSGAGFVAYHEDLDSMLMAGFFAVGVLAYLVGLYLTARMAD